MDRREKILTTLLVVLLLGTVLLSVKVTRRAAYNMIEGDAATEMVLANYLSRTHEILTKEWVYSNELRVLFQQLVFTPLFSVISEWSRVRFVGTLIMQALMLFSFAFMMRQAGQRRNAVLLGCTMLLVPYCVVYGRIGLYQALYLPYVTIGFLIVGLLISVGRYYQASKKVLSVISLIILCVFTFLACLNGIRTVAEVLIPAALVLAVHVFLTNSFLIGGDKKGSAILWGSAAAMLISGLAGYLVSSRILSEIYTIADFTDRTLAVRTYFRPSIWECILHQFGYRTNIPLMSLTGILSLCGLFTAFYCYYSSACSFAAKETDLSAILFRRMLPVCTVCIALEMILIENLEISTRYFISASVWMVPLLCSRADEFLSRNEILPKKCAYFLCIGLILANGFFNMLFFLNPDGIAKQTYEGLPETNPKLVGDLKRSIDFLLENDYDFGFAPFWTAGTITEKTDGKIPVTAIWVYGQHMQPHKFLKLKYRDYQPAEKVFLLLDVTNAQYFPDFEVPFEWKEVYRDIHYVIYDVYDLDAIRAYLKEWDK